MNYLKYLVEEIHTTVMATTDANNLPVTCAIDVMDYDDNGLYFLTAKGKNFYDRLKRNGYVDLTGMKGKDTMSCVAVSLRGKVKGIAVSHWKDYLKRTAICTKFIRPSNKEKHSLYFAFMMQTASGLTFQKSLLKGLIFQ